MNRRKRKERRERRNKIIKWSWQILDELERWKKDHSNTSGRGTTVFKGNGNLMTKDEFALALRQCR